ncbi:WecB/TagA/CpsF family glycosyltransferase [Succinispira mobilis]|uniref:WecB/TagA/CpsF family glycosyltransferase n=1 Tax=Succinispira mobilis TaxID=78120 RepID=UPI00037E4B57|nr:WecB/TagA/CpsF family glycosyltransferase [Succinispira mobilis]
MLAKILGISVACYTMQETIDFLLKRLLNQQKTFVVTANAEIIMLAQNNKEFNRIITKEAELVLPDGAGVVLAARYLGYHMPERVAGCDLVSEILKVAADQNLKVYFLGAAPKIAQKASELSIEKNPGLKIAGVRDGFFSDADVQDIIDAINASEADILLVALGVPKQEIFLNQYREQLKPNLLIGVGGTFDVMAGNVKRAPVFMQKNNLEWLYRFLMQPSRFLRILAIPKFIFKVFCSKLLDKQ